jgi:ribosome-associated protein
MRRTNTEETLNLVTEAMMDKKAEDVQVLDLQGRTLIADYFVVCTGTSNIHIRAIVDGILDKLADVGIKHPRIEGYSAATWVLIDTGDVVTHVFAKEEREFFDLESLWRDVEATLDRQPSQKSVE